MRKYISIILTIVVLVIWVCYVRQERQALIKDHHTTMGVVVGCDRGGRGNWGPGIYFKYFDGNKWQFYSYRDGNFIGSTQSIVGKSFPVVYAHTWYGNIQQILITPNNFGDFNYPFPDSLNWVLKHLKKRQ